MKAPGELYSNQDYKEFIESHFKRFSLDLNLCSPRGLRLSQKQLSQLFTQLELNLPPHLATLAFLIVTLQAGSLSYDDSSTEIQSASIQIFTPHSTHVMLSYEAKISDHGISLETIYIRPPAEIRKRSLQGNSDNLEDLFVASTVLNPVVFIVDDSPMILLTLSRMLKKINPSLTICTFKDGSEVVELYTSLNQRNARPCSLILMDKQMPKLDGVQATKQIRAFDSYFGLNEIPIVAITAQTDLNESELLNCGISGFCFKPFTETSIKEVLLTHNLMPPILEPIKYDDEETDDSCNCRLC